MQLNLHKTICILLSLAAAISANHPQYYEYRFIVANGVQNTYAACREKFKWDRWNCPRQAFIDVLRRHSMPSNKELGFTRALIAAGIVLQLTRSCSYGTSKLCNCSPHQTQLPTNGSTSTSISGTSNKLFTTTNSSAITTANTISNQFSWDGCDESVKFAFSISKTYLESQDIDIDQDEASRRINAHNYEVGRLAIRKGMKRMCKCHGVSGTCQVQTCWTTVPDTNIVVDYLKKKWRVAAKVGAMTTADSDMVSLDKELTAMSKDRIVFADASPDYCYENTNLGINGTLGRYCSRPKPKLNSTLPVSKYEAGSCDRLCTECGYKVKHEVIKMEKQCLCRFIFCCNIQCMRCPHEEEAYKCVRHI